MAQTKELISMQTLRPTIFKKKIKKLVKKSIKKTMKK